MNWKRFTLCFAALALIVVGGGMAISATFTDFTSGDIKLSKSALEPAHNYVAFVNYRKFDFGDANLNGGSGVTNGDVIQLFNVPENTYIEEIGYRVTTAALQSGTSAEVGDGADIDGFVGNDYTSKGVAFFDLSKTSNGVSRWALTGIYTTGATDSQISGVSMTVGLSPPTGAGTSAFISSITYASNHGPYFTSGISPYIGKDTIDMTIYVDKSFNPGTGKRGVTPVFETYIKGFKRVAQ